ncbi:MAG: hypothetical protein JWO05_1551 [Gemmatimonadetes bacterium]|nr:hypothetical protein [Gemmatimonadota bacterium]
MKNYRDMPDDKLIDAMCVYDDLAWKEYFDRFRPAMLVAARHQGIPPEEREFCVDETLDDVSRSLVRLEIPIPDNVAGYLVWILRSKWLRRRIRNEMRIAREEVDAPEEPTQSAPYPPWTGDFLAQLVGRLALSDPDSPAWKEPRFIEFLRKRDGRAGAHDGKRA